MLFKQFVENGMEPIEAMRLEKAVEHFSSSVNEEKAEKKPAKETIKKVAKNTEAEEDKFNPIMGIVFILGMVAAIYCMYFTMPAWMVI